jgi:hypothetical protein
VNWLSRRPGVRVTVAAMVLAGTGVVLSGAAPAAGQQIVRPSLEYTCHSTAGSPQIPAQVAVSIPGTATAGQPIRPAAPAVAVTLPHAYREQLGKVNASTVSVAAQLRGEVTENGRSVADQWLLKSVSAALPSSGDLPLRVTGAVQPITEPTAGNVTFTVGGLSLLLAPRTASGAAATMPATTRLDCTLNPGQSATLATVPVTAATGHSLAGPARAGTPGTPGTAGTAGLPGLPGPILWEVAPGGAFSGGGRATFQDATRGTVVTCKPSTLSGTMKSGRDLPGAGLASLTSDTFSKCSGPGGKAFTVTASASAATPWLMNAESYDPPTGTVTLTVSGIMASISGPGCKAAVAGPSSTTPGTVKGTKTIDPFNITDTLSVSPSGGTLHAWNVSGCSGLFSNGDNLSFTVAYSITPIQRITLAYCPPFPVNTGFPFNNHFKFPKPPPGSTISLPQPPLQGCAFIKGFSEVRKLGEAALIGPGFGNIQVGKRVVTNLKANYFETDSSGKLYFKPCPGSAPRCRAINGLPPVTATFLSFGFLPTTATLQITQAGTLNVVSVGTLNLGGALKFSRIESLASIRVEKVLVNGTPLNVGSNCHTVRPFKLVLTGKPPYSLNFGGVMAGTIDVPPFTGCGVGENIDQIFNASVSGPKNIVKLTQGPLCTDWPPGAVPPLTTGCPAPVPKPVH